MNRALGGVVAVVSGSGFPLSQFAIARLGRPGAAIVTVVTAGVLALDVASLATRDPAAGQGRERGLLAIEVAAATVATVANLAMITEPGLEAARARGWQVGPVEMIRRISLGVMFGMRAARFRRYLEVGARRSG